MSLLTSLDVQMSPPGYMGRLVKDIRRVLVALS